MRGKVGAVVCGVVYSGITPAYAGKSTLYSGIRRVVLGSPPRMRGKALRGGPMARPCRITPAYAGKRRPATGITPAYAGKSAPFLILVTGNRDHPRVCGEKRKGCSTIPTLLGSPPRMRGKGPASRRFPARAEDHPRVCGEKAQTAQQTETQKGSPPRMRGKVAGVARRPQTAGITPAYAGKRCVRCRRSPRGRDHPRVCGEKTKKIP